MQIVVKDGEERVQVDSIMLVCCCRCWLLALYQESGGAAGWLFAGARLEFLKRK